MNLLVGLQFWCFSSLLALSALDVYCMERCIKKIKSLNKTITKHLTKNNVTLFLLSSAISCLLSSVNLDLSQYALDIVKGLAGKCLILEGVMNSE